MNGPTVIDSSVAAAWFLPDESSEDSRRLAAAVGYAKVQAIVPELWHYEVLNVLRIAVMRGRISQQEAKAAMAEIEVLRLESVPALDQGNAAILAAATEHGLTAYDAAYFALADARGAQLVTGDDHLLRLRDRFPWILSLEDFCARLDGA